MLNVPSDSIKYAKLTYADNSARLVKFCNDQKLLLDNFIMPVENAIFDIEKEDYVNYDSNTRIEVFNERPSLDLVDEFASTFI